MEGVEKFKGTTFCNNKKKKLREKTNNCHISYTGLDIIIWKNSKDRKEKPAPTLSTKNTTGDA